MSRIGLAFACFFRLLFNKKLPPAAAKFLPEDALPKQLPPTTEVKPKVEDKLRAEPKASAAQQHRDGALALLALLQREGRLVDFLLDSLEGAEDAQIGAVAREVHRTCRKVLDQHLSLEAVMPGEEDTKVQVPKGFDPAEIRLVGEAKGEPPFRGTLRHHGWRVVDVKLPTLADGIDRTVIAPAEVEL